MRGGERTGNGGARGSTARGSRSRRSWVQGSRARAKGALTAALAVSLLGLAGCGSTPASPDPVVRAYLGAWAHRDWNAMIRLLQLPADGFTAVQTAALGDLGVRSATYQAGAVVEQGSSASVPVTSRLTLASKVPLTLHSALHLQRVKGKWWVVWTPRTISAALGAGDHFSVNTQWPPRAAVTGAGGVSLIPNATVVTVGLAGLRIKDPATLRGQLLAAGLDATDVDRALAEAEAHPDDFEPIQTMSQAAYTAIQSQIHQLPGTQFETSAAPTPLTPALGAQIVGGIGPITAQQLKTLGAPYAVGDQVGQGGIEEADERQLAGSPSTAVVVLDAAGKRLATVASRAAVAGRPVQTSIDPSVQGAAEGALAGVTDKAAIVVERASTGEVLASVSTPTVGFDLALDGAVPPGSTFKVVTTTALLQRGVNVATTATCPPTIDVGGRSFHNDEGESTPSLSFLQAFAQSCNTAFIGLSQGLSDQVLTDVAATYGIGINPKMGLAAYGGKVPAPTSDVDLAATAIGQGQVTVSPLAMATVAATVDSGILREPRLVTGAPDDTVPGKPIDAVVDAALRTLMGAVVTDPAGTAAGAGLPSGTFGKTGTAEFGSGPNPPTHAWFIGFDGDLAFAVFVYGGGTGGTMAAPLAAKMLKTLGAAA